MPRRDAVGISFPFDGMPILQSRDIALELIDLGITEIWTGEVNRYDAISPLAMLAGAPSVWLSCAVVNPYTRGPALLAMTAAALSDLAPGRARFGLGAASPAIVQRWNGLEHDRPLARVRAALRFLREVLTTGRASTTGEDLGSRDFVLAEVPSEACQLVLGASGQRMHRLAAELADGVVLNFVSPGDVDRLVGESSSYERTLGTGLEHHIRVFAVPSTATVTDDAADVAARRHLAGYLTVPAYRAQQERLGRGTSLAELNEAWASGDRRRALRAIPAGVVADLVVTGDPAACAARIDEYLSAGATTVTVQLLPPYGMSFPGDAQRDFLAALFAALRR